MNRHLFIRITSLVWAAVFWACTPVEAMAVSVDRPHILFILIDDMGWKDIGCAGSTYYNTPHIDGLASRGMRFLNAYSAAPVCTPSRGAIYSGKYPARTQLTTVFRGPAGPDDRLHDKSKYRGEADPFFEARHRHALPRKEVILAQALAEGGYRTAFFGKWHIGECPDYYPEDRGFQVAKGYRTKQDGRRSHWMKDFENAAYLDGADRGAHLLYNLAADPQEQHDLAGTNTAMRDRLSHRLTVLLSAMKAEMPAKNSGFDPNTKGKRYHLKSTQDLAEKERSLFETRLRQSQNDNTVTSHIESLAEIGQI